MQGSVLGLVIIKLLSTQMRKGGGGGGGGGSQSMMNRRPPRKEPSMEGHTAGETPSVTSHRANRDRDVPKLQVQASYSGQYIGTKAERREGARQRDCSPRPPPQGPRQSGGF